MLALVSLSLAGSLPALLVLGQGNAPPGARATWAVEGCNLEVTIHNDGETPFEVDWNRSVYAPKGGAAVGLVPGSASKVTSMSGMQPLVVPPGSYGVELLFRRDRLPVDGTDGCLFDVPGTATVTLRVAEAWLVQSFDFQLAAAVEPQTRTLSRLDVHVGEVCFKPPGGYGGECIPATGPDRSRAWEEVEARMVAAGCDPADARKARDLVQAWKSARTVGNLTVWFYGVGLIPYAVAGGQGDEAERLYRRCMSPE